MRLVVPFAVAVAIYWFSATTGAVSAVQSGFFVILFEKIGLFSALDYGVKQYVVRKIAHLSIYTALGGTMNWALWPYTPKKAEKIAFFVSVIYAMFDEAHQILVAGRYGTVTDVLIDSLGVLMGVCLASILRKEVA
ncbi:VanZ family protein [Candidatus Saccharibacteria bacterium]|nr:VanZ family protein [Candidatus Saccharibacteria bacterium]